MKRFVIEITDDYSSQSDPEDRSELEVDEYLNIIRHLKEANLCDDIQKDILVICDICKSFLLPIKRLYYTIEKLRDYTDYEIDLYEIENKIKEVVHLSNEEWGKYFIEGIKGIDFICSDDEGLITDSEGNPYKYLWEECAVIFDSKCGCNSVMIGESDDS